MAAKWDQQLTGDGFTSHIAGMSKSQLYDIMCQMKGLIEQNQQQARHILIDNPLLTRALFQAQIMLGMVQPSQAVPKIQQALSQPQVVTQSNAQITQPSQSQASLPQLPIPARQQPSISLPSASNFQSQPQTSAFVNSQGSIAPPPQSSQLHNVMPPCGPPHYSHIPMVSGQPQHSLQAPGLLHPMPQYVRPPSMQPFAHQQLPQMPPGLGFQPPSQPLFPQSLFHSGVNLTSFTQGQPPLHSQQQIYQGFPSEYGNQAGAGGSSMQPGRGGHWAPEAGGQFTPFFSGQMPGGNPPPLPPDVEKALLQQVMSLTAEQISLLPPEQRHQVIQLQEMLR